MKRGALVAFGLTLIPLSVLPVLAAGPWDGTYVYEQPLGPGAGGTNLFVTHTLTINGTDCRIVAQGYQTDDNIRCRATANGDKLAIAFVSYGDGSLKNKYGTAIYEAGQPLFTLARNGAAVATTWQAYNKSKAAAADATFKKK